MEIKNKLANSTPRRRFLSVNKQENRSNRTLTNNMSGGDTSVSFYVDQEYEAGSNRTLNKNYVNTSLSSISPLSTT